MIILSGIPLYFDSYRRMSSLGILPLMHILTSCLLWSPAGWTIKTLYLQLERNSNFLLLRNYLSLMYSFGLRPIISLVYGIISWCQMYRLLQTSESTNFLLEIQAISTSMSITLTFGMCTQNLELRGIEPATKFCNRIRRSSWEYRYSLCVPTCTSSSPGGG